MKRGNRFAATVVALVCAAACGGRSGRPAVDLDVGRPPAAMEYVTDWLAKPPSRYYIVKFELANRHDRAMWYILL